MIAYNCDLYTIIQALFTNRNKKHRIQAYSSIMKRLANRGHKVDVQIFDNEVSAEYKRIIVDYWDATYQLVPPNVHRRNISKRSIRTIKAHLLLVLAGVDPDFPILCGKTCWAQQISTSTSSAKPHSTHAFQCGNISMAHLTMQQLRWVPLDVKLSTTPHQILLDPGIKEDAKYLV